MLRVSLTLLRRGKPRPRAGMFPDKYRRVPSLLKPQQGGQQYFSEFLVRSATEELEARNNNGGGTAGFAASGAAGAYRSSHSDEFQHDDVQPLLPQMDAESMMNATGEEAIRREMKQLVETDAFCSQRGFNERQWYEEERRRMQGGGSGAAEREEGECSSKIAGEAGLPERVLGTDYFHSRYGYSLLKSTGGGKSDGDVVNEGQEHVSEMDEITNYAQLDLWGEMPKYNRNMIFLYLVSRRRNTYAVAYDYDGKRILNTYTAGNRGLKGGDRGFRGDGSTDNGHQVTSMYLNDLLPKIREARASAGRPLGKGEKIELVVRVMGFYNGRQGAVRAVQDRSAEFTVRYLEDITPFPQNGPKMPRGVFR